MPRWVWVGAILLEWRAALPDTPRLRVGRAGQTIDATLGTGWCDFTG